MLDHLTPAPATENETVVEHEDGRVLSRIAENPVMLAVWRRPLTVETRALSRWLDVLPPERIPEGRFVATPDEISAKLGLLCDMVELAECPMRALLIADIAQLGGKFACLARVDRIDVKLEAVENDSCWRFHRDYVALRLNATYRGPGTQWVRPQAAAGALRAQRRYHGPVEELPRFAAGLFKGTRRAGSCAIVHRSPPIEASGLVRLFLCLNEDVPED